jgi:DNA-binding CsgD family transcriptional regulator
MISFVSAISGYLLITNVSPNSWCKSVVERRQVIGRAADADMQVPQRFRNVSRRHAEIWSDESGSVWMQDLGSRMGTRINGVPLEPHRAVRVLFGDRVSLGGLLIDLVDSLTDLEFGEMSDDADADRSIFSPGLAFPPRERFDLLSPAEMEVAMWMCRGFVDDPDIAGKIHRSPNTVRTHVGKILEKLGFCSRAQLVSYLRIAKTCRA